MSSSLTLHKIASADPTWLFLNPRYHQHTNGKVLTIVVACVAALAFSFYYFFPYSIQQLWDFIRTFDSDLFNVAVYVLIYVVAVYGIFRILYMTVLTEVEIAIARVIGNQAVDRVRNREKEIPWTVLERITNSVNNTHISSSISRLSKLIADEARDKKFVSSTILMEPYKDESNVRFFKIGVLQKTALQLGILGTFIGLILGFGEMDFERLDASLDTLFVQLQYAFTTSIAGLVSSIILGLFLSNLRAKQEVYFQTMEESTNYLTSLARRTISEGELLNGLHEATNALNQNTVRLTELEGEVSQQNKVLSSGMQQLANAKIGFNDFIKELSDTELGFMKQMEKVYEVLGPEKMSGELKLALEKASTEYLSTTQAKFNRINQVIEKTNQNIRDIEKHLAKHNNLYMNSVQSQEKFIKTLTDTHVTGSVVTAMKSSTEEISKGINKQLQTLTGELSGFTQEMGQFNANARRFFTKKNQVEKWILITLIIVIVTFFGIYSYYNFL